MMFERSDNEDRGNDFRDGFAILCFALAIVGAFLGWWK